MQKISEHQLQNQIINYLRYKRYYVDRMNSGKMRTRDSRGKMFFVQLHPVGTPDLMAFKTERVETPKGDTVIQTRLYFIEVKVPGNKPTRMQTIKMQELINHGAKCIVAHSVEELGEMGI